MTRLVKAELYKLLTTKTFYGLLAGSVGITAMYMWQFIAVSNQPGFDGWRLNDENGFIFLAERPLVFGLVLGVLAITNEFRHGSAESTYLVQPDRIRVMGGKLIAVFIAGFAMSTAVQALLLAIGRPVLLAMTDDVTAPLSLPGLLARGASMAAVVGLCAVFGLGVGAVIRNQVAGIIGVMGWALVAEFIIRGISMTPGRWTLTANMAAAEGFGDPFHSVLVGFALMITYCGVAFVVGTAVQRSLDVTA